MSIGTIKAVLFDLDGTLIDTEKYYKISWPLTFEHFGYKITEEQALSLRSLGKPYIQDVICNWLGKNVDCEEVGHFVRKLVNEKIEKEGLQLKKGVIECLEYLKLKKKIISIVTATTLKRANDYVTQLNIKKYFDYIISAIEVKRGKPAPDVYLYACEKIGVAPSETIAVEDSPNGSYSAINAGCNVVMVPDLTEPNEDLIKKLFGKINSLQDFEKFANDKKI